jgi:hypothetical protein
MPNVEVTDPVKLEMYSHLDKLLGQPLPTFQSAMQGIRDWNPAQEWNQNVQNAMFGAGNVIKNIGHAVTNPVEHFKNLKAPTPEEMAMAFNPSHIPAFAGSLAKYIQPSVEKGVWYHGTSHDIKKFDPKLAESKPNQAVASFVTQSPEYAEKYALDAPIYMAKEPHKHLTPEQITSSQEKAKQYFRDTYPDMPEHADSMIKSIEKGKPVGEAEDQIIEEYKKHLPSGPNIMPVHVRVENPFDPAVPEHVQALKDFNPNLDPKLTNRIGVTAVLEHPDIQEAIKGSGFDSFYTNEDGYRNLGVFKPEQIKSAIGNEGTFDPTNPVITKKDGGSVNKIMSQFMPTSDDEPYNPINEAKRNLQGAWDIIKQVPTNVANLVSDPVGYAKNLPVPTREQMAMMFQPGKLSVKGGIPTPKTTVLPTAEYNSNLANYMAESKAPSTLYHGTDKSFSAFDQNKLNRIGWGEGFHLAEDPSLASQYAGIGTGANVMPVHASIKNPLVLNSPHDWWDIIPGESDQAKTAWAKSQGYDGIKYPHSQPTENQTGMAWVAFEPTQIKSAIGNRGTFDPTNPVITKKDGGSVTVEDPVLIERRLKLMGLI